MVSFGFHWYIQVKEPSVNFVYVHPWLLSFRPRNENLNLLVRIKSLNLYLYCSYKKINNLLVGTKFYWSWAGDWCSSWGQNKVLLVLGRRPVLIVRTEQSFTGLGPVLIVRTDIYIIFIISFDVILLPLVFYFHLSV